MPATESMEMDRPGIAPTPYGFGTLGLCHACGALAGPSERPGLPTLLSVFHRDYGLQYTVQEAWRSGF